MKKLFTMIAFVLMSFAFSGCDQNPITHTATEVMDAIEIGYAQTDTATSITQNITLPLTSDLEASAVISWQSSNMNVIDNFGTVNRKADDESVTLILTVTLGSSSVQKTFDVVVLGTTVYHDVTFNVNGETDTIVVVDGQKANIPNDPVVTGYRFDGWTTDLQTGTLFDFNQAVTTDLTIYAIMTPVVTSTYTIEIYLQNLTDDSYTLDSTSSGTAEVGTVIDTPTTKDGFVLNSASTTSGTVTEGTNLEIAAYFDRAVYTLTLMDGDNVLNTVDYKYQETVATVTDPVKDGYNFLGWTEQTTGTDYYVFGGQMTQNVTLYAQWQYIDNYTYTGYYEGADGLTGQTLVSFLRTVVTTGFTGVSYGDARYILDETDQDPNNPSNVILVYLGISVSGVWDDGNTWNREHVWPQSLLYDTNVININNSYIGVGSDLYNLKPANPSENSSRGNDYFDESGLSSAYEPRDAVKGDIARILFYMTVRYDNLTLVNSTSPAIYQMAMLNTLLKWNAQDPVDSFELHRNDVVYSYQHNRNPFVDHPEFVDKIWGTVPTSSNDTFYTNLSIPTTMILDPMVLSQVFNGRYEIN